MSTKSTRTIIIIVVTIITSISLIAGFIIFMLTYQKQFFISDSAETETAPAETIPEPETRYHFDYSWAESSPYVAHGLGAIYGETYTNSLEAFLLNYQLGQRVFEADFSITDDKRTVLAHDAGRWHDYATVQSTSGATSFDIDTETFTYNNFQSSLWLNKYHTLTLEQLFQLMQSYPDVYIVTDTKFSDQANVELQFNEFVNIAKSIDESLLDRLIIQIYTPEMLDTIMAIYPWKSVIYTLYEQATIWTPENVLAFAEESGVKFITMRDYWVTPEIAKLWHNAGIKIAVHTVNNLNVINTLRTNGVDLFYTDSLLP